MTAVQPFELHVPDEVLDDLRDRLARTRLLDDSPRKPASGMSAALPARARRHLDRLGLARPRGVAQRASAVHRADRRRRACTSRTCGPSAAGCPGPARHARLAAHLRAAARLRRPAARLPRRRGEPARGSRSRRRTPTGPMSEKRIAATMHALMTDVLGYERYVTYGEDVTANVSDLIAARYPEHVAGIVATHAHFPTGDERAALTDPDERAFFDDLAARHEDRRRLRARAGDPARHARRRAQRLPRRPARLARREARRVERHPAGRSRRRSSGASRATASSPRR